MFLQLVCQYQLKPLDLCERSMENIPICLLLQTCLSAFNVGFYKMLPLLTTLQEENTNPKPPKTSS
jgi:hypothetical protein